jgi:hypothetical protein
MSACFNREMSFDLNIPTNTHRANAFLLKSISDNFSFDFQNENNLFSGTGSRSVAFFYVLVVRVFVTPFRNTCIKCVFVGSAKFADLYT